MRSRHTSAILTKIECGELVVTTPDEFVNQAITLARTPELVQTLKAKVVANISNTYRDLACIKGLEDTLITWTS